MSDLRNWCIRLIAFVLLAATCVAQNPEGLKFYKLEFTVKEMEATRALSSRTYYMVASTEPNSPPSLIRAGSKVPVSTSSGGFQFLDVGVNIDCRSVKELQNELSLNVTADVSSTPPEPPTPAHPIVRQNKWSSTVVVPVKKPTLIFSSDDVTTKRQIQLELTATPIK